MPSGLPHRLSRFVLAAGVAVTLAQQAAAQQQPGTGTIHGTVVDAGGRRPIAEAQVFLSDRNRGGVTDERGRFTITGVTAGTTVITARRIGFRQVLRSVTVSAGDTSIVDLELTPSALALDQVIITGTAGVTEKRAIGNTVSTIDATTITDAVPVPNVASLLQGRSSSINVMSQAGTVGAATNIRIRGTGSLGASYNPVVYVDGIRVSSGVQRAWDNVNATVQATSALDAINPEDIESIEVIKGPAAATLYGADAANGVIQIITKKGRMGQQSLRWQFKTEKGSSDWAAEKPVTYWLCRPEHISDPVLYPECVRFSPTQPAEERLLVNRPLDEPLALRVGDMWSSGLSLRGGAERYSFYISADRDEETGVFYNNFFDRTSGRANFRITLRDNLDIATNVGYAQTAAQIPLADNSSNSVLRNAFRGRPSGPFPWAFAYRGLGPAQANLYDNQSHTERFILGSTLNYQPWRWLQNRLTLGLDLNDQRHTVFYQIDTTGRAPHGARFAPGYIGHRVPEAHQWTLDYSGTATSGLPSVVPRAAELSSSFSVGLQLNARRFESYITEGEGLVADKLNTVGAAARTIADQEFEEQNSLGLYVQEQLSWRDRLFVTGAVRVDDNSAFGREFSLVTYPKASVSYVISEEPFFNLPHVDQLKLRAAWGQAGNAPDPFSADRVYEPTVAAQGDVIVNQLTPDEYGNPNLKAETGEEYELGFDASFFRGRAGAEFTYYNKRTKDALVLVPVAPSTGFTGSQFVNIGEIANSGLELALFGQPLAMRAASWDVRFVASTNKNRLVSFGGSLDEMFFGTFANVQKHRVGYPLGGYWATDVVRDAAGQPVLNAGGNVQVAPGERYVGSSLPIRELSLSNTFTFWQALRLYVYGDYKGGHYQWSAINYVRDRLDQNTYEVNIPNPTPEEALRERILRANVTAPHIMKADFVKLREISLSYSLPARFNRALGGADATVTLSGRNLGIWKIHDYRGADPEVNFDNQATAGRGTFNRTDYSSAPMLRRFTVGITISH